MKRRAVAGQDEDPRRRHPLRGAARPPAGRAPRGGARRRLPDLQRGLLGAAGPRGPRRRGDPARPAARRADARRARGPRPPRAHALPRRAPGRPGRGRRDRPARRPGPVAVGCRAARRRPRRARPRARPARPRRRTCCRRRSRRCRPSPRSTGRRSPRCTRRSRRSPARRWSSSTARSRSPRRATPETALAIVDGLALDDYRYAHSTRAELLRRLDRPAEARAAYERALALAPPAPERRFLERRLAGLSAAPPTTPGSPAPPGP